MVRAIVAAVGLNILVMVHWPECKLTTAIISSIDAAACVRRYLVDPSIAHGLNFFYYGNNG